MPPNTDEDPDRDLYVAIGRLVTESARFEDALDRTLHVFVDSDYLPVLFAGQSWEWYIESIKAVVAQFVSLTWRKEREELLDVLNASRELRESRNWIVHGVWKHNCYLDDCIASSTAAEDSGRLYHFFRSRIRKELIERQFTVTDIEILTDRISELGRDLRRLRKIIEERIYEYVPDGKESS